ncbi:MAG TPA: NAD(P)H-binding protein [Solirubrobacteraceae bacterium]|jgi:uncharacterized protein YbjT (DUF2867 family)|nr:NAD(P)H-binding protein [Solirubrobacteraceae bacterium]
MPSSLVIGGAGRTGRHIVDRLRRDGAAVKVLSRNPDRVPDGVEAIAGDITRPDSVAAAMRGVDSVVLVVESAMNDDGSPNSPTAVHDQGTANVIAAAADGAHVVMVSQIYITRPDAFPAAADVIAARGRGEQALRDSALACTIVRPSWLTDDPGGRQALRLEQGDTGDGQVARADVAEAVAQSLTHPEARGKTFELYGEAGEPPTDWAPLFARLQ